MQENYLYLMFCFGIPLLFIFILFLLKLIYLRSKKNKETIKTIMIYVHCFSFSSSLLTWLGCSIGNLTFIDFNLFLKILLACFISLISCLYWTIELIKLFESN